MNFLVLKMVFTIREFKRYFEENIGFFYSNSEVNKSLMMDKKRRERETKIIKTVKPCIMESNIYSNLDHIKDMNLSNLYNEQFYSEGFMRYLSELSCPIYYPMSSNGSLVKEWLKDFKKIGAESVEGVAIMATLSDHDKLFIIKGPRSKSSDLAHEAIVGLALNPLRAQIPNFSWVFGVIRCSLPITDKNQLVSWCNPNDPVTYVVYERVPGVSLKEFISTCSVEQFIDVFLQICEAEHVAYRHCQFTHYDLHYDNIIIRPLSEESTIAYEIGNNTYYHSTSNVATFIDYGFSHAVYQGEHFGRYDFQGFSVLPERGYPIFDIFKLLCFCLQDSLKNGSVLSNIMIQILSFFTKEPAQKVISELGVESGIYYSLPIQLGEKFSLDELISYIITITKPKFISLNAVDKSKVLSCKISGTCIPADAIVKYTGLDQRGEITSIVGYKIALMHNQVNRTSRENFKDLFTSHLYAEYYANIRKDISVLTDLIQETKPLVVFSNPNIALRNIRIPEARNMYKVFVNKVVDIVSKYNQIIEDYDILILIMKDLGYETNIIFNQRQSIINTYKIKITRLTDHIKNEIKVIEGLRLGREPELAWFTQVLPNYTDALTVY